MVTFAVLFVIIVICAEAFQLFSCLASRKKNSEKGERSMKKIIAFLTTTLLLAALPALAHVSNTFHAHPHGAHLDPADTTMLFILGSVVSGMIIGFVFYAIYVLKKNKRQ